MLGVPWCEWLFYAGWWLSGCLVGIGIAGCRVLRLELHVRVRFR